MFAISSDRIGGAAGVPVPVSWWFRGRRGVAGADGRRGGSAWTSTAWAGSTAPCSRGGGEFCHVAAFAGPTRKGVASAGSVSARRVGGGLSALSGDARCGRRGGGTAKRGRARRRVSAKSAGGTSAATAAGHADCEATSSGARSAPDRATGAAPASTAVRCGAREATKRSQWSGAPGKRSRSGASALSAAAGGSQGASTRSASPRSAPATTRLACRSSWDSSTALNPG